MNRGQMRKEKQLRRQDRQAKRVELHIGRVIRYKIKLISRLPGMAKTEKELNRRVLEEMVRLKKLEDKGMNRTQMKGNTK